jgi:hypothetical protein
VINEEEADYIVSQNVIASRQSLGGALPFAFTEAGVSMLATVLRSDIAVLVSITIIRTFIALRAMAVNYADLLHKIKQVERTGDKKFKEIYGILKYLLEQHQEHAPRNRIGYKK